MKKDKFVTMRVTEEELARLEHLAGSDSVPAFMLQTSFAVKPTRGNEKDYPGWDVVQRGRRDGGIKIRHPKYDEAVILYPEDKAYADFV